MQSCKGIVLLLVFLASVEGKILKKGECNLTNKQTGKHYIKMKVDKNDHNVDEVEFKILKNSGIGDTFKVNLKVVDLDWFVLYVDLEEVDNECEVSKDGVEFNLEGTHEESGSDGVKQALEIPKLDLWQNLIVLGPAKNKKILLTKQANKLLLAKAKSEQGQDDCELKLVGQSVTVGANGQEYLDLDVTNSPGTEIEVEIVDLQAGNYLRLSNYDNILTKKNCMFFNKETKDYFVKMKIAKKSSNNDVVLTIQTTQPTNYTLKQDLLEDEEFVIFVTFDKELQTCTLDQDDVELEVLQGNPTNSPRLERPLKLLKPVQGKMPIKTRAVNKLWISKAELESRRQEGRVLNGDRGGVPDDLVFKDDVTQNANPPILGPATNAKINFKKNPNEGLFLEIRLEGEEPAVLDVGGENVVVSKNSNILLFISSSPPEANHVTITIVSLAATHLLYFNNTSGEVPLRKEMKWICLETNKCPLLLKKAEFNVQLSIPKDLPKTEVEVEGKVVTIETDESYLKKVSKKSPDDENPVKLSKGSVMLHCTEGTHDDLKVQTTTLKSSGDEMRGRWVFEGGLKRFKLSNEANISLIIANKHATKPEELLVPLNTNSTYVFEEEALQEVAFMINKGPPSDVIREDLATDQVVEVGKGRGVVLRRDANVEEVGVVGRPEKGEMIELMFNVLSCVDKQARIKVNGVEMELEKNQKRMHVIRLEEFGSRGKMVIEVVNDARVAVARVDVEEAVLIDGNSQTFSQSGHIHFGGRNKGLTLLIDNTLAESGSATLQLERSDGGVVREFQPGTTNVVFLFPGDFPPSSSYIKGSISLQEGKKLQMQSQQGIQTFELQSGEYFVRENKASFEADDKNADYDVKFTLNKDSPCKKLIIGVLNKDHVLNSPDTPIIINLPKILTSNKLIFKLTSDNVHLDSHIHVEVMKVSTTNSSNHTSPSLFVLLLIIIVFC